MRKVTSREIEALQLLSLRPLNGSKVVNYTKDYTVSRLFIKTLRWAPLSLLGGRNPEIRRKRISLLFLLATCILTRITPQRRRRAPTLRKNGCSVAPCVRRYLWYDTVVHRTVV